MLFEPMAAQKGAVSQGYKFYGKQRQQVARMSLEVELHRAKSDVWACRSTVDGMQFRIDALLDENLRLKGKLQQLRDADLERFASFLHGIAIPPGRFSKPMSATRLRTADPGSDVGSVKVLGLSWSVMILWWEV